MGKELTASIRDIYCTEEEILEKVTKLNPSENIRYRNSDDITNGLLFADTFGSILRFNVTANQWYVYDGIVWKEDTGGLITEGLAQRFQRVLYIYAIDSPQYFQKSVQRLGSRNPRNIMIQDARNYHIITATDLDSDGYLLNCKNCVVDLRTFETLEHNAKYLLSKVANVNYIQGEKSDLFESFMDGIMLSDSDKIRYLQKIHGYALTGKNQREECYLYYGATTRNGKSTLLETYSYMLGDYARNAQPETLAQVKRTGSGASEDVARLAGCRFLHISEPPKRMIFDVALLKTILGRDKTTARFLHKGFFEFTPEFKLIINTNHLPVVNDDSLFSSNRVKVVPFERHFEDSEQDKTLKDRLKSEENLSGLLNWCLEGLRLYQEEGLEPPETIVHATQAYREESDKLKQFVEDCLEPDSKSILEGKYVYENYTEWCHTNGYGCENKKNFFEDLKSKKLLSPSGTIGGRTVRNVIKGYRISIDLTKNTGFKDATLAEQAELNGVFST